MQNETIEALRSAQELCAYLWNNTDANNPEAAKVELIAHSDKHAELLAALLNDARERVGSALHGLELTRQAAPAMRLPTVAWLASVSDGSYALAITKRGALKRAGENAEEEDVVPLTHQSAAQAEIERLRIVAENTVALLEYLMKKGLSAHKFAVCERVLLQAREVLKA